MNATLTGSEVTLTYQEPSTNEDGSPLSDLAHTSIYFSLDGVISKVMDVPATSPNGGGNVEKKFVVPIGEKKEATVILWATASDLTGNEGPKSTEVTVRIDHLAPNAPV